MPVLLALLLACACSAPQPAAEPAGPLLDPALMQPEPVWQRLSVEVMATRWQLVLPTGPAAEQAAREVFAVLAEVDRDLNEWKAGSPLAEVNRQAGGDPVRVPADLRAILRRSMAIHAATDGAFDVTWAALWGLWDFSRPDGRPPDPQAVQARLPLIDARRIEIDDRAGTVRLPKAGMAIGLGGIAKGWALDRAAERLRAHGVQDWLLQGGGQVLAGGSHDGRPWVAGMRDPRGAPDDLFAELQLEDGESVSTTGDYERCFESGGVRYHHILDPRTGWPTRGLRAAIVVAREAALADALSTALMVLGRDRGLALLAALPGVQALVVGADGQLDMTPGLRPRLRVLHAPLR